MIEPVAVREQDQEEAKRLLFSSSAQAVLESEYFGSASARSAHRQSVSKSLSPPVVHTQWASHDKIRRIAATELPREHASSQRASISSTATSCDPSPFAVPLPPTGVLDAVELFLRPSTASERRKTAPVSGHPDTSQRQRAQVGSPRGGVSRGVARRSPGLKEPDMLPHHRSLLHLHATAAAGPIASLTQEQGGNHCRQKSEPVALSPGLSAIAPGEAGAFVPPLPGAILPLRGITTSCIAADERSAGPFASFASRQSVRECSLDGRAGLGYLLGTRDARGVSDKQWGLADFGGHHLASGGVHMQRAAARALPVSRPVVWQAKPFVQLQQSRRQHVAVPLLNLEVLRSQRPSKLWTNQESKKQGKHGGLAKGRNCHGDKDSDSSSNADASDGGSQSSSVCAAELLSRRTLYASNTAPLASVDRKAVNVQGQCGNAGRSAWPAGRTASAATRLPLTPRVIYKGGAIASSIVTTACELTDGNALGCERAVGRKGRPGRLSGSGLTPHRAAHVPSYHLTPNCLRTLAVPLQSFASSVLPATSASAEKELAGDEQGCRDEGCGGWSVRASPAKLSEASGSSAVTWQKHSEQATREDASYVSPSAGDGGGITSNSMHGWSGGALSLDSNAMGVYRQTEEERRGVSPSPLSRLELLHRRCREQLGDSGSSRSEHAAEGVHESREELLQKLDRYYAEQSCLQRRWLFSPDPVEHSPPCSRGTPHNDVTKEGGIDSAGRRESGLSRRERKETPPPWEVVRAHVTGNENSWVRTESSPSCHQIEHRILRGGLTEGVTEGVREGVREGRGTSLREPHCPSPASGQSGQQENGQGLAIKTQERLMILRMLEVRLPSVTSILRCTCMGS